MQTLDISWTVNSVGAGGEAEITLRYDRVRLRSEMPPLMPFEFDSNDTKAAVQPGFEAETQQLKAIVGAEVGFKIRAHGRDRGRQVARGDPQEATRRGTAG